MTDESPAADPAAEDEAVSTPQPADADAAAADDAAEDASAIWAELKADEDAAAAGQPQAPEPAPANDLEAQHARQLEAEERRKERLEASAATATGDEQAKIQHGIKSATGRIHALQRKIAAAKELPGRDTKTARDAIAGIKEDYPEIAKPIEDALGHIEGKMDRLYKAEASAREADQHELNTLVEAETNRLLEAHGDYASVLRQNGTAFQKWVDDQPRALRDAAYRNAEFIVDAGEAIEVVGRFKRHLGLIKDDPAPTPQQQSLSDRRQRQIAASATPHRTSSRPAVTGAPPDGADRQSLWNYWKAADEAQPRQ